MQQMIDRRLTLAAGEQRVGQLQPGLVIIRIALQPKLELARGAG